MRKFVDGVKYFQIGKVQFATKLYMSAFLKQVTGKSIKREISEKDNRGNGSKQNLTSSITCDRFQLVENFASR